MAVTMSDSWEMCNCLVALVLSVAGLQYVPLAYYKLRTANNVNVLSVRRILCSFYDAFCVEA